MVKLYCPKCMDVYTPKSSRHHHTDGAYFGTGFPHMLFMVHPEYRPKRSPNQFVPRLVWITFIFQVSARFYWYFFIMYVQVIWFQNSPNGIPNSATSRSSEGSLRIKSSKNRKRLTTSTIKSLELAFWLFCFRFSCNLKYMNDNLHILCFLGRWCIKSISILFFHYVLLNTNWWHFTTELFHLQSDLTYIYCWWEWQWIIYWCFDYL